MILLGKLANCEVSNKHACASWTHILCSLDDRTHRNDIAESCNLLIVHSERHTTPLPDGAIFTPTRGLGGRGIAPRHTEINKRDWSKHKKIKSSGCSLDGPLRERLGRAAGLGGLGWTVNQRAPRTATQPLTGESFPGPSSCLPAGNVVSATGASIGRARCCGGAALLILECAEWIRSQGDSSRRVTEVRGRTTTRRLRRDSDVAVKAGLPNRTCVRPRGLFFGVSVCLRVLGSSTVELSQELSALERMLFFC